jgi:hypothetical protein
MLTTGASAQWIENGNPIIIHSDSQNNSVIVHDGSGGAYIAWLDYRNVGDDIYIQHLDGYGRELWTAGGILLTSTGNQRWAAMAPDGEGGVLIAWHDDRNGTDDIYAQRLDADGNELWTSGGVAVTLAAGHQRNADIASDGSGGAVIVWDSYLSPGTYDIYAQRIDYTGTALWTTNGEPVCTNGSGTQNIASVVVDTISSYVYFCWQDFRTGTGDIYAQRYSLSGSRGWTVDGKVVCSETNHQLSPQMILNRNGNIVICWRDLTSGALLSGRPGEYRSTPPLPEPPMTFISAPILSEESSSPGMTTETAQTGFGHRNLIRQDQRHGPPTAYWSAT